VTISEAVLGAKVEVPTVEGPVTLTVPPGRPAARGYACAAAASSARTASRGDQIARVEIVAPKTQTRRRGDA
jgi:molecular chaperone DnaJ